MKKRAVLIKIVICSIILIDCSSNQEKLASSTVTVRTTPMNREVIGKWNRSCALCHLSGEAGAPIIGDKKSWSERLGKGEDVLVRSVVEGLNSMPPLGYCMACEIEDFRSMVSFMVRENLRNNN